MDLGTERFTRCKEKPLSVGLIKKKPTTKKYQTVTNKMFGKFYYFEKFRGK